jgi:hypothetical protein
MTGSNGEDSSGMSQLKNCFYGPRESLSQTDPLKNGSLSPKKAHHLAVTILPASHSVALAKLISPSSYTCCYLYIQSYDSMPIYEQFCDILHNHATCVVLLTFISYFTIYTTVFMPYVSFCKHFWDPKHVHCHLIHLC